MLVVVSRSWRALGHASAELRSDRNFVMEAGLKTGPALEFASEKLRSDRDLVMAAVSRYGSALKFASEELRSDRDLVMIAVSSRGDALEHASEELRSDRDVVMIAVSESWQALQHAPEEFRSDPEIIANTNFGSRRPQALVLKATLLSGRSCTQVVPIWKTLDKMLRYYEEGLGLERQAAGALITLDGTILTSLDQLQPGMLHEVTLVIS